MQATRRCHSILLVNAGSPKVPFYSTINTDDPKVPSYSTVTLNLVNAGDPKVPFYPSYIMLIIACLCSSQKLLA